jgi:hypothetical protein
MGGEVGVKSALPWLVLTACTRDPPPRRRPYVEAPPVADVPTDAMTVARVCALRAAPPEDLSVGEGRADVTLAWNGAHFGAAWVEPIDDERVVMFVRVSPEGRRMGSPLRVSERGFKAARPSLAWNGVSWSLVFEGGIRTMGDIYQARVDARGSAVGRPWRMTRGDREDTEPVFVNTGQGFGLAWISREFDGRYTLYGEVLNRWDAPLAPPTPLLNTSVTLSATRLLWTGQAWALSALSSRRNEVLAVSFTRMEADGTPRGILKHPTPDRIGSVDTSRRYDLAWDGVSFGAAWSELRDGANRVYFRRVTPRGNFTGDEIEVSHGASNADEPALTRAREGLFVLALRVVEPDGSSRVWVRTIDPSDRVQEAQVELQAADGHAGAPALVSSNGALGVAAIDRRGLTFHLVSLGSCGGR